MKAVIRNACVSALLLAAIFIALMPTSLVSTAATSVTFHSFTLHSFTLPSGPTIVTTLINPTLVSTFTLAPAFDFAISASPTATRVIQGRSVTFEVFVNLVSGTPQPVTLYLSGPTQMSYSFSSNPVTPNCCVPVSLSIITGNNLPAGQYYTLKITGIGGADITRSTTVSLWVDFPSG